MIPAGWAAAVAAASIAVLGAAPWLDQRLAWSGLVATAAALVASCHCRGWRREAAVLITAVLQISLAFHWAPRALADALQTTPALGLAFTLPIIAWDACRLAVPCWVVGRMGCDPRAAWLPAALAAVVAEAVMPAVFPWKLGYATMGWPVTMQVADLGGAEATTFTFFAHAGSLVVLAGLVTGLRPARIPPAGLAAVAVSVASLAYGAWALEADARRVAAAPRLQLALVQANPERADSIDDLRRLTRAACRVDARAPDLVCWPECSGGSYEEGLDSFADEEAVFRRSRPPQQGLRPWPDPDCPLLLGGRLYRGYPERPRAVYQAALLLDDREQLAGAYRKRHLMPFGEYVPGADVIPDLRLHVPLEQEYAVGASAEVLACGPARLGVLLCYEDMVPEAAASLVRQSANLLVSLVNGAVFTDPLTLAQHRLLAQARAIETRRWLVRCAATGETCTISSAGVVAERLPLDHQGVLAAEVPLLDGLTPAVRFGGWFPAACGLGLAALAVAGWRRT